MFLWLLPVVVFIGGLRKSLSYYAAREEKFGAIAWSGFASAAGGAFVTTAWGFTIGASAAGLFAGYLISALFGTLILIVLSIRRLASDIRNAHLSFEMIWTTAKQHKKFPIFSTWSGLLNTVSAQLPPIMLGLYFSTTVVGYYSLGYRLVSLPMGLLGGSIAQVFFPAAAKEYNETGTLSEIVRSMFKRLVQMGVFPLVVLGLLGSSLFGFILGEKWIEAGVYAQILSVWILLVFVTSPLSTTFSILGRQGTGLVFNVGIILSRAFALLLGTRLGGPRLSLTLFAGVSVIGWIFMIYWILRNSGVSLLWGMKTFLKYAGLSFVLVLPAVYFAQVLGNMSIVFVSLVFAAVIYVYGIYRSEPAFRGATVRMLTGSSLII